MPIVVTQYSNAILEEISFRLEAGKHLIILGANGVGKTTLAKLLCGLIPASEITIQGMHPSSVYGSKRAKAINYIPPKLEVFDAFITVRDYLSLGALDGSLSIDEAMERLGIQHLSDQFCISLSSGEAQLLMIASALLHHASYTIFDEPTANLDPQKMQTLFGILKAEQDLQSKIIITHNLDFAYQLGFDILYLAEKRIQFQGTSSDFFSTENLDRLYAGSVEKRADNIVVKL